MFFPQEKTGNILIIFLFCVVEAGTDMSYVCGREGCLYWVVVEDQEQNP